MRRLFITLCAASAAFIFTSLSTPVEAQKAPGPLDRIAINGEGVKGVTVAIPKGDTVRLRLEGFDKRGKRVPIDASKVKWRGARDIPSFTVQVENGTFLVTAMQDVFDLRSPTAGKGPSDDIYASYVEDSGTGRCSPLTKGPTGLSEEPSAMLFAEYEGKAAAVTAYGVLNLEGTWHLSVTGTEIDLHLKQSGRWVKDDKGRRGEICGRLMGLEVNHPIWVFFIKSSVDLEPLLLLTSRTEATGKVKVPDKPLPVTLDVTKTH